MIDPTPQPQPTDGVLGGSGPPTFGMAVLGGLEAVKRKLDQGGVQDQIAALAEALNYGSAGQALIDHQDRQATHPIKTFISFYNHYGAAHPAFQRLLQSQVWEFEVVTVDEQGSVHQRQPGQALSMATDLGHGITLEMVAVPGGTFLMGSPDDELKRRENEGPQHWVTVPPFYLGRYPVTQAQWRVVAAMPQENRELEPDCSYFKGDNLPIERVNWDQAVEFCDRLSHHTGTTHRLPTEAEWEYACRGGTTTPFHFGKTMTPELANYDGSGNYAKEPTGICRYETTPGGSFPANGFGLQDMHGNVLEWCLDHWHHNYVGAPIDGSAWINEGDTMSFRVLRSGAWCNDPGDCRSASRWDDVLPGSEDYDIGFRVVCSPPGT